MVSSSSSLTSGTLPSSPSFFSNDRSLPSLNPIAPSPSLPAIRSSALAVTSRSSKGRRCLIRRMNVSKGDGSETAPSDMIFCLFWRMEFSGLTLLWSIGMLRFQVFRLRTAKTGKYPFQVTLFQRLLLLIPFLRSNKLSLFSFLLARRFMGREKLVASWRGQGNGCLHGTLMHGVMALEPLHFTSHILGY
uniref:Uncharacterized protein n=1 Tax=Brassica oleracea TaxID=3712 RepID=A0A3P6F240_BRAOL|nr:unnamed protein product [Brassica oleracea]